MSKNRNTFNFSFDSKLHKSSTLSVCLNLLEAASPTHTLIGSQVLFLLASSKHEWVFISPSAIASRLHCHRSTVQRALAHFVHIGLLKRNDEKKSPRYNFGDGKAFSDVLINYLSLKNGYGQKPDTVRIETINLHNLPMGDQVLLGDYLRQLIFNQRSYNKLVNNELKMDDSKQVTVYSYEKAAKVFHCCRQTVKRFIGRMSKNGYLVSFRKGKKLVLDAGLYVEKLINKRGKAIVQKLIKQQAPNNKYIPPLA